MLHFGCLEFAPPGQIRRNWTLWKHQTWHCFHSNHPGRSKTQLPYKILWRSLQTGKTFSISSISYQFFSTSWRGGFAHRSLFVWSLTQWVSQCGWSSPPLTWRSAPMTASIKTPLPFKAGESTSYMMSFFVRVKQFLEEKFSPPELWDFFSSEIIIIIYLKYLSHLIARS